MQREIKFRGLAIKPAENGNKLVQEWIFVTLDEIAEQIWFQSDISDNAIFFRNAKHKTQFTGLKDKNGVEVYEGDIIKYNVMQDGFEPDYRFEEVKLVREPLTHDQPGMIGYHTYPAEYGEVIGNIYENPELLGSTLTK